MSSAPTATTPAQGELPREAKATIALAILGIFVTYVPVTAVSVALTTISRATGASTAGLQWVSDAYVIPMAAAVLSAGVFGDIYGRRRVYLLGMSLTITGGTVAGLLAGNLHEAELPLLWTGQAIAGLGAGLLIPTTFALIAQAVPNPRQRGTFIGLWSGGLTLGLAAGPVLTGLVIASGAPWPFIYAPTVSLAVIAAVCALRYLPESASVPGRRLDWPGQIIATIAIATSIFGIIQGGEQGWTSTQALIGLSIGLVAFVVFVVVERRTEAPLVDFALFKSASFSAAGFAGLIALFSIVGCMFLLSLFFGYAQQLTPIEIAGRLICITGIGACSGPVAAKLQHRFKSMYVLSLGMTLSATGLFALTFIDADTSWLALSWRLALFGIGNAFAMTAVATAAVNSVPFTKAGMAAATNTVLRQFGGALGPAVLGVVFSHKLAAGASVPDAFGAAITTNVTLLAIGATACLLIGLRQPAVSSN